MHIPILLIISLFRIFEYARYSNVDKWFICIYAYFSCCCGIAIFKMNSYAYTTGNYTLRRVPERLGKGSNKLGKTFAENCSWQRVLGVHLLGKHSFTENQPSRTRQRLCRAFFVVLGKYGTRWNITNGRRKWQKLVQ